MNALYFFLGVMAGVTFCLLLFSVWYDDEDELEKQANLIRRLDEFERKAGKK